MTDTDERSGARLMADAFRREGAGPVFGVMGDINMDWMIEMASAPGAVVHTRDEGAAVSMADGYARGGGRVGIATTTCGPGLTHTATALRAAVHYRTPIVLLAGQQTKRDNIQYLEQVRFLESLGVGVVDVTSAEACEAAVPRAFYRAIAEERPVVMNIAAPVFKAKARARAGLRTARAMLDRASAIHPDPAATADVAEMLRGARRPLILVGRGAAGAAEAIEELAEAAGALTAATLPAHGWTRRPDFDLGLGGFFASPAARELMQSADIVIAVGTSLHHFAVDGGLYARARMVLVDQGDPGFDSAVQVDRVIRADAQAFVRALATALAGHVPRTWRVPENRERIRAAITPPIDSIAIHDGRLDSRLVVRAIDQAMPPDRISVTGAGHFWNFAVRHMQPPLRPRLVTHGFGSIGHGMTTAIGAMLAGEGRPGVVFEGDSGLLMNIQELDTLARLAPHLLVVVMNNTALGSEYYKLKAEGRDPAESVLPEVDFATIARGFGVESQTITALDQLAPAVARFLASGRPMLLDAKTSLDVVDENYRWW